MKDQIDDGEIAGLFERIVDGQDLGPTLAGRLSAKLSAPVEGIILYGSLARGRRGPRGDINALVIADSQAIGIYGVSGKVELDLTLCAPATLPRAEAKDWLLLDGGRVLYDVTGEATRLLERVRTHRVQGPEPWSPAARARAEVTCRRLCGRIAANLHQDAALAAIQAGTLRHQVYEAYFRARGLWPRGAKEALEFWRAQDPAFAGLAEEEACAGDNEHRLDLLAGMVEHTFRPKARTSSTI